MTHSHSQRAGTGRLCRHKHAVHSTHSMPMTTDCPAVRQMGMQERPRTGSMAEHSTAHSTQFGMCACAHSAAPAGIVHGLHPVHAAESGDGWQRLLVVSSASIQEEFLCFPARFLCPLEPHNPLHTRCPSSTCVKITQHLHSLGRRANSCVLKLLHTKTLASNCPSRTHAWKQAKWAPHPPLPLPAALTHQPMRSR